MINGFFYTILRIYMDADKSIIERSWPESELEYVESCPYCGSKERIVAYQDVQDWSFYCAPGKWTYWDCSDCKALYLSPRPTEDSIGKAYSGYFTHVSSAQSFKKKIKVYIKNECFSHWLNTEISPRIGLPRSLGFLLAPFKAVINIPYELEHLVTLPKGKLLDVGCGSGDTLKLAKELGWNVIGLEIDLQAVEAAREIGLEVIHGGHSDLQQFDGIFDCIICSHVLEHVHHPVALLDLLSKALKPKGFLFLSLPNSASHVRTEFGENWRGLEAPRHLSIPTIQRLQSHLKQIGFKQIEQKGIFNATQMESNRISRRALKTGILYFLYFKISKLFPQKILEKHSDLIQMVNQKKN